MSCPRCGILATVLRCTGQRACCVVPRETAHRHLVCMACCAGFPVSLAGAEIHEEPQG